jgi:threonine/homoserine/homoserine lactone efflux protein
MDIVIPDATSIGVFAVAAILLLTPGPAVLYIVARSVEQGRIAGLASVCGITTGTLVHVLWVHSRYGKQIRKYDKSHAVNY